MSRIIRYLLCLLSLFIVQQTARAQQFPVTASTQIIPPYSVYLPDYAVPGSDKLRVILVQNDLTRPSYDVRLQMTVERNGTVIMRTAPSFTPKPLTLSPGVPTIIGGTELYDYLNSVNIEFSGGFSRDEYERTKSLPEGAYRVSFTAYDYRRSQVQVSNVGANVFFFQKSDPPLLNLPICGSRVEKRDPQFMNFNWSTRNSPNPLPGSGTEYVFSLYEIKPAGSNPDYILRTARPIYTITTESNTLVYGPGEPLLVDSMQYVWTVQARDKSGRDLFSNQGLSKSCTFTYLGNNPFAQFNIGKPTLSGRSNGQRSIRLSWPLAPADAAYTVEAYRLQYRATKKDGVEFDWLTEEKQKDTAFTVNSLEPGRSYEARLQWRVAGVYGAYSDLVTIKTDTLKPFVCGDATPVNPTTNNTPLVAAKITDIVRIGHFDVLLTQVSGGNGTFSGVGRVITPGFGIGLKMEFKNITINSDMLVTKGEMYAATEGIDKFVKDKLDEQRGGNDVGQVVTGDIVPDIKTNLYIFSAEDIKVDTTAKTITLTNSQSGQQEVINYKDKGKTLPLVLEDAGGNLYNIDKNGKVTSAGRRDSSLAGNAAALAALNTLQLDKGEVTFSVPSGSKYAFDAWKDSYAGKPVLDSSYELLANGKYRVSAKATQSGVQDVVIATLKNAAAGVADSLKFVSGKGIFYPFSRSGDTYTITITGGPAGDAQEVYAVFSKTGGGYTSIGKLLVASYPTLQKKVVLIPIGASTTVPVSAIESSLKSAYEKIGVVYTVEVDESFRSDLSWDDNGDKVLQDSKSAFLSNGFTGEEKAMKKAYKKSHDIDDNTVYLFVVNEAALSDGDLLGKMPRQSQFGFIFTKGASTDKIGRTVAHEIGHGDYTLEHTFSAGIGLDKSSTNNLMDYGSGYELLKYQWNIVHDPGHVWGIFDGDGEQESVTYTDITVFRDLSNKPSNTYTFVAPSNKYITLPPRASSLVFSTIDRTFTLVNGTADLSQPSDNVLPLGALEGFTLTDTVYQARSVGGRFVGYYSKYDVYKDPYSATLKPTSGIGVFLAVKDKEFKTYASRFAADQAAIPAGEYIAEGDIVKGFSLLNLTTSSSNASFTTVLGERKVADAPMLILPATRLSFTNNKVAFDYKDGGTVTVKEFLLDVLKDDSPLPDFIHYFTLANLKENELQAFASCLGNRFTWDVNLFIDIRKKMDQDLVRLYGPSPTGYPADLMKEYKKKTLEELVKLTNTDVKVIEDLHTAIAAKADAKALNEIFVKSRYVKCALVGLPVDDRIYILNKFLEEDADNDYWYTDPSWYTTNDGRFIVKDILETTPDFDQVDILKKGFMANNYQWLRSLWENADAFWANGVGYYEVHDLFDVINPWIVKHYDALKVPVTQKNFSDPIMGLNNISYAPVQTDYIIGMKSDEIYSPMQNYQYRTDGYAIPSDIDFKDNGRITFRQIYSLDDISPIIYEEGKAPNRTSRIEYKEEFDPFEPMSVITATSYVDLGFDGGQQFILPAYMTLVYDRDMERIRTGQTVRKVANVVTISVAILAAPETGGSSLAAVASVTSAIGAVISSVDLVVQAEKNKLTVAQYQQNKEFYDRWDKIKTVSDYAQLSVAGYAGLKWGWSKLGSAQKLSTALNDAKTTFKNIPSQLKGLSGGWQRIQNFTKGVVKGKYSIKDSKLFGDTEFGLSDDMLSELGLGRNADGQVISSVGQVDNMGDAFTKGSFHLGQRAGTDVLDDVIDLSSGVTRTPKLPAGGTGGGGTATASATSSDVALLAEEGMGEFVLTLNDNQVLKMVGGEMQVVTKTANALSGEAKLINGTIKRYVLADVEPVVEVSTAPEIMVLTAPGINPQLVFATAKASEKLIEKKKEQFKCKLCNRFDQKVCEKFVVLQEKVGPIYAAAVTKLCSQLTSDNVNGVLDKLLAMDITVLYSFLNNIVAANTDLSHITTKVSQIDADIVDAWKLMKEAKGAVSENYQVDFEALKEVKRGRADATFMNKVGNDDGFKAFLKANRGLRCKTCQNTSKFIQFADEYIKDAVYFAANYTTAQNADGMWSDLKQPRAIKMVYGAAFQIRVLRVQSTLFAEGTVHFDDSLDDSAAEEAEDGDDATVSEEEVKSRCRYDIRVSGSKTNYFEFKSWGKSTYSKFKTDKSKRTYFANQFKAYLRNIESLDQLNYVFDSLRMTNDEARTVLQKVLEDNAEAWFNDNDPGIPADKIKNLFAVTSLSAFRLKIANLSNDIYRFVKRY